jgi:hypothetical protein
VGTANTCTITELFRYGWNVWKECFKTESLKLLYKHACEPNVWRSHAFLRNVTRTTETCVALADLMHDIDDDDSAGVAVYLKCWRRSYVNRFKAATLRTCINTMPGLNLKAIKFTDHFSDFPRSPAQHQNNTRPHTQPITSLRLVTEVWSADAWCDRP